LSPGEPHLERLRSDHDLAGFESGVDELDAWLGRHALAAQEMDSARTFVVVVRRGRVVGYASLTMGSLQRSDATGRLVRGMPSYPVGMVLIARLAVDKADQGAGLGTRLLADALRMAVVAGETVAARVVAVDAIDERAARFYGQHGFTETLDHPFRLYRRMKDLRASLEEAVHASVPDP
jgi:GNAT superfamily N-acetyltransferase